MRAFDQFATDPITGKKVHLGCKRAILVHHRQSGKDELLIWAMAVYAYEMPGARIGYCMPENKQISSIIAETGRLLNVIPNEFLRGNSIEKAFNKKEQRLYFANGSTCKFFGSDRFESIRGHTFDLLLKSEWQSANYAAWNVIEPALTNDSALITVGTSKGKNHFYKRYMQYLERQQGVGYGQTWGVDPQGNQVDHPSRYFAELIPLNQTQLVPFWRMQQRYEELALEYGPDEAYLQTMQEYFCSWEHGGTASYWGYELNQIEQSGKGLLDLSQYNIPFKDEPFILSWDLGKVHGADPTVLTVFQVKRNPHDGILEYYVLDYKAANNLNMNDFLQWAASKGYICDNNRPHGYSIFPHDFSAQQWPGDITETMNNLNMQYIRLRPSDPRFRNEKVRQVLRSGRCYFDLKLTLGPDGSKYGKTAWQAYLEYSKIFDQKLHVYKPLHDWASHPSDSLSYGITGIQMIYDNQSDIGPDLSEYHLRQIDGQIYIDPESLLNKTNQRFEV